MASLVAVLATNPVACAMVRVMQRVPAVMVVSHLYRAALVLETLPFVPNAMHWSKPKRLCANWLPRHMARYCHNSCRLGKNAMPNKCLLRKPSVTADLPTPAAHMDARRALQLQLLTRRNDPSPAMTWAADAAQVLGASYDETASRRLQAALKVLLKK